MLKRILIVIFFMSAVLTAGNSEKSFFLSVNSNLIMSADSNFRTLYSGAVTAPEFKAGYSLTRNLYLWGGLQYFSVDGKDNLFSIPTESSQTTLSLGAGTVFKLGRKFEMLIQGGLSAIKFKESVPGTEVSENLTGVRGDMIIRYLISGTIFTETGAGYMYASKDKEQQSIKAGGLKLFLGVGIKL